MKRDVEQEEERVAPKLPCCSLAPSGVSCMTAWLRHGKEYPMSTHKQFWRELMRVWAQWLGLGLAAIPSGVILGVLEQRGVNGKAALAVALSVGFVLALVLWVWIGRRFAVVAVEYTTAASPILVQFESQQGALMPTAAFATAVLVISMYCVQTPSAPNMPPLSIATYAPAA